MLYVIVCHRYGMDGVCGRNVWEGGLFETLRGCDVVGCGMVWDGMGRYGMV